MSVRLGELLTKASLITQDQLKEALKVQKETAGKLGETLIKLGAKNVGFESHHVSMGLLETMKEKGTKLNFAPIGTKIEQLRSIKDPSEIEQIRVAVRIAERAFQMFQAFLTDRDSEKDCVDAMESYIRRAGAKSSSFPNMYSGRRQISYRHREIVRSYPE